MHHILFHCPIRHRRKEGRKLSFVLLLLLLRLNCLASLDPSFSWQPSIPIQCATFDMTVGVLACLAMYSYRITLNRTYCRVQPLTTRRVNRCILF